ncbi:uncharacterized protein LOC141686522 [Apium graveolens]|uniref:uncharacterized protein LOC141686522 n=1 Tax=Apium graveolens TaxID=4045 RepID=UPI003D7BC16C
MASASDSTSTDQNIAVNNHDSSSVYYIHPSDASSTQLVSVKFDGNGFNNWKRSMLLVLSAKNKIGFVDGTIEIPDKTSPEYKFWAREILYDLEERYGYASMTKVYSLEQKLSEIVQGSQNISEFFTAIKTGWDVRANVLMMQPLPNVSAAYNLFAQEERHKEISQVSNQN